MHSEFEDMQGKTQTLEIKFTPVIFYARPSIMIVIRDVTEREIIKRLQEEDKTKTKALA